MKFVPSWLLLVMFSLAVMSGCSVKEERDECPCRLFLDISDVDMKIRCPLLLNVMSGDGFEYMTVVRNGNLQDTCVLNVPRTGLNIVGWSGYEGWLSKKGLLIPYGCQCPPVYIHSVNLHADGESVYDKITLNKSHCVLSIRLLEGKKARELRLRGDVAGFDNVGRPQYGAFSVASQLDSNSTCPTKFCIPRQDGNSLYLDVIEFDGMVKTFPLHEYIAAAGYDWEEMQLKDLSVDLKYTLSGVSVTIVGWGQEFMIDVVI